MPMPTAASKVNCDASTDDPKLALLTDLATLIDKFNELLAMRAAASGYCDLDAGTLVPSARLATALAAIYALTPAEDRGVFFTSPSAAALFTLTTFARSLLDDADAATARTTLGLATVAQAEAEAGTATTERAWTAQRVGQAIAALTPPADVYLDLISSASITAVASIDLTLDTTTYSEFKLVLDGVKPGSSGTFLWGKPLYGSAVLGGTDCTVMGIGGVERADSFPVLIGRIASDTNITGCGGGTDQHGHCVAEIGGFGSSLASGLSVISKCGFINTSGFPLADVLLSRYAWDATTERLITGIRLAWGAGSFLAAGTYKLYGLRRALA